MIRGRVASLLLFVLLASPARAQGAGDIHAVYQAYAAGLHVADVEVGFAFGPWSYQVRLAYHTVGLAGFFWEGHQFNTVTGKYWPGAGRSDRERRVWSWCILTKDRILRPVPSMHQNQKLPRARGRYYSMALEALGPRANAPIAPGDANGNNRGKSPFAVSSV